MALGFSGCGVRVVCGGSDGSGPMRRCASGPQVGKGGGDRCDGVAPTWCLRGHVGRGEEECEMAADGGEFTGV